MNRRAVLLGFILLACYAAANNKVLERGQEATPRAGYVTIGGKEYYVDDVIRRSWNQSVNYCGALAMKVVTLENQAKNDLIYGYLRDNGLDTGEFWTGGSRVVGAWTWVPLGEQFSYTDWAPGQPSSEAVEDCAFTTTDGWADDSCNVIRHYICQH